MMAIPQAVSPCIATHDKGYKHLMLSNDSPLQIDHSPLVKGPADGCRIALAFVNKAHLSFFHHGAYRLISLEKECLLDWHR